ncbi:hypothetical protein GCM10023114_51280 [Mycolicibacterium sediminis]|uniref:Uncharacterized protein n=1 Tax=Mycolicibacterium sediminis TaxID=1286180 RepID=A0A7I7QL70_9MYCO|nr:hypothetical protein MSEDJ_12150 [Mycolicibacterium sediminis]
MEVLPCDGLYLGLSPTPVAEVFAHGEEVLQGHPLDRPSAGVALVEQVWAAGEFVEEVGVVEGEVTAEADVVDADQFDCVLKVASERRPRVMCWSVGVENRSWVPIVETQQHGTDDSAAPGPMPAARQSMHEPNMTRVEQEFGGPCRSSCQVWETDP